MRCSPLTYLAMCGAGLMAAALSATAETATTDPVGFVTLTVAGKTGTAPSALSMKSLALARAVEYQGNAELASGTTIVDTDAVWTVNQFNGAGNAWYLEITGPANGAGIGTTYDIINTDRDAQTLTLAQNLATGVTNGATFRIRKHWTIGAVFGLNNEGGLGGGTAETADTIRIFRGQNNYETYIYLVDAAGNGWRKLDSAGAVTAGDQSGAVIYPDDGLLISRRQATDANIVLMGSVKTGPASYPIVPGLNVVGNPFAGPMTLEDSKLYTGDPATGLAGGTASKADWLQIYNGTSYDTYFYSSGGGTGVGWRKTGAGSVDQKNVQIPVGSSIIVQRRGGGAFNWVTPQHPANL